MYNLILKIYLYYKKKFKLPIYRKDILNRVKINYSNYNGLCFAIIESCEYFNVKYISFHYDFIKNIIPEFGSNVESFGGIKTEAYWWKCKDWKTGRLKYLNWLIKIYRNDKTIIETY